MEKRKICFYVRNSTQQQDFQYQIDNLSNHLNKFNDVQLIKIFSENVSTLPEPKIILLIQFFDNILITFSFG